PGRRVDGAARGQAGAVRGRVAPEREGADDRVGVQDLTRAQREAAAELQSVLAGDLGDAVEDLEVVLVGDQRLVAVRAQVADVLEGQLRHPGRRIVQVDPGDADGRRGILQVVDRRHEE